MESATWSGGYFVDHARRNELLRWQERRGLFLAEITWLLDLADAEYDRRSRRDIEQGRRSEESWHPTKAGKRFTKTERKEYRMQRHRRRVEAGAAQQAPAPPLTFKPFAALLGVK